MQSNADTFCTTDSRSVRIRSVLRAQIAEADSTCTAHSEPRCQAKPAQRYGTPSVPGRDHFARVPIASTPEGTGTNRIENKKKQAWTLQIASYGQTGSSRLDQTSEYVIANIARFGAVRARSPRYARRERAPAFGSRDACCASFLRVLAFAQFVLVSFSWVLLGSC